MSESFPPGLKGTNQVPSVEDGTATVLEMVAPVSSSAQRIAGLQKAAEGYLGSVGAARGEPDTGKGLKESGYA